MGHTKATLLTTTTFLTMESETEKKSWVEFHARHGAALPIINRLENELVVGRLKSKELEMLLR